MGAKKPRSTDQSSAMLKSPPGHNRPGPDIFLQETVLPQSRIRYIKFSSIRGSFSFIAADFTKHIQNGHKSKSVLQDNGTDLGIHRLLNKNRYPELYGNEFSSLKAGV